MTADAPPHEHTQIAQPPRASDPAALRMFHRVLDADLIAVRQALIDMRHRFDGCVAEDAIGRIELVLAEVMNNIVHHSASCGTAGPARPERSATARGVTIHLTVTRHEGGLACAVSDDGSPLPLACLTSPDQRPGPEVAAMRDGGFGWYIIRDLTQSLFYFREDGRNVLCFNIPRSDSGRAPQPHRDVA